MQKEEVKPNEVESKYVLDSESEKESKPEDEMVDIADMAMEEYKKRMRDKVGSYASQNSKRHQF